MHIRITRKWAPLLGKHAACFPIQSNLVNPAICLSGNLLFGQNSLTPKLFIIPLNVLVRNSWKKIHFKSEFYNPEFGHPE